MGAVVTLVIFKEMDKHELTYYGEVGGHFFANKTEKIFSVFDTLHPNAPK